MPEPATPLFLLPGPPADNGRGATGGPPSGRHRATAAGGVRTECPDAGA
jgi:hypothetical protein